MLRCSLTLRRLCHPPLLPWQQRNQWRQPQLPPAPRKRFNPPPPLRLGGADELARLLLRLLLTEGVRPPPPPPLSLPLLH